MYDRLCSSEGSANTADTTVWVVHYKRVSLVDRFRFSLDYFNIPRWFPDQKSALMSTFKGIFTTEYDMINVMAVFGAVVSLEAPNQNRILKR